VVRDHAGVLQYHKSGDMRILLLTRRAPELPGVPSGRTSGSRISRSMFGWDCFAHPKTPKPVHDRLVAAVSKAVKEPGLSKSSPRQASAWLIRTCRACEADKRAMGYLCQGHQGSQHQGRLNGCDEVTRPEEIRTSFLEEDIMG